MCVCVSALYRLQTTTRCFGWVIALTHRVPPRPTGQDWGSCASIVCFFCQLPWWTQRWQRLFWHWRERHPDCGDSALMSQREEKKKIIIIVAASTLFIGVQDTSPLPPRTHPPCHRRHSLNLASEARCVLAGKIPVLKARFTDEHVLSISSGFVCYGSRLLKENFSAALPRLLVKFPSHDAEKSPSIYNP